MVSIAELSEQRSKKVYLNNVDRYCGGGVIILRSRVVLLWATEPALNEETEMLDAETVVLQLIVAPEIGPKSIDLHVAASVLHKAYPERSLDDLALRVAEIAVAEGCRFLIWEPPSA